MPPAVMTTQEQAMAEMEDFAEKLTNRLLDQMRTDHEESARYNAQFRDEVRAQVAAIRESMAAMIAREEGCAKRLELLENKADSVTGKLIGLLLGVIGAMGAALLSLWHGGSR